MAALVTAATEKVRNMLPGHSTRFSDARIKSAIHLADLAIREECELEWASYEIELLDGAMYYTLPTDVVQVKSVEFSRDGIVYDQMLEAVTIMDMDELSLTWQDDTATSPSVFSVVSVPGTEDYSKLLVWRPCAATSGEKVRVNYVKCRAAESDINSVEVPDNIIPLVYLPSVLGHLLASEDPDNARAYMAEYYRNLPRVRARYGHRTQETKTAVRGF